MPLLRVLAFPSAAPLRGGHSALLIALFPIVLLSLAADRGPVAAVLASRFAGRLGARSHAVDLLRPTLIGPRLRFAALLERHRVPEPALTATIVAVLLLLPSSALACRFVELPARRFVRSQSWRDAVAFERSGAR